MRLAGERRQRCALNQIARLVKDPAFERERLIGADAIGVRTLRADGKRLGLRQLEATSSSEPPPARYRSSTARSSTSGATDSASSPAADRRARRLSLLEARTKGPSPRHSGGSVSALPA